MPFEAHRNAQVTEATLPGVGAAVVQDQVLDRASIPGRVTDVSVIPEAALVANAAAFRTFRLINKGQDGTGATVIASRATSGVPADNQAAFDEWPLVVTANNQVAVGDVLAADELVTGAGVAHSGYRILAQIVN